MPGLPARTRLIVFTGLVVMLGLMTWAFLERADPPDFRLGAAVAVGPLRDDASYRELVRREFRGITPENALKLDALQPERGRYDFRDADLVVDFAEANGLEVRGHALVWHRALPGWVAALPADRDVVTRVLRDHIRTTVGRYRGRIATWDVVNEAVADDGTLRDTIWLRAIGPEYVELAFRWAHEADPGARLYYNDYGAEGGGVKADAVHTLVRDLRARGVPVHGVGLQMHVSLGWHPAPEEVARNAERLADLGVEVAITEMDVRIADGEGTPDERLRAQAELYRAMGEACRASGACRGLTTWGVTDRLDWVDGTLRTEDAPWLFDARDRPKPALDALRALLRP